jgi:hypothetical protein
MHQLCSKHAIVSNEMENCQRSSSDRARIPSLFLDTLCFKETRELKGSGARVNPTQTASDKQRRRAVYAFHAEY